MLIVIGSVNPVKVEATKDAFKTILSHTGKNDSLNFQSIEIKAPTLNNTPNSIEEMIQGATFRAEQSCSIQNADFGIGIEGGIFTNDSGTFLTAFAVVQNGSGSIGIGSAPAIKLPDHWKLGNHTSFELGSYVDHLTGGNNIKQKNGAMGILTDNILPRKESLKLSVICAYFSLINEKTTKS